MTYKKVFSKTTVLGNHLDRWVTEETRGSDILSSACCMRSAFWDLLLSPWPPHPSLPRCIVMYLYPSAAVFFKLWYVTLTLRRADGDKGCLRICLSLEVKVIWSQFWFIYLSILLQFYINLLTLNWLYKLKKILNLIYSWRLKRLN